jgi:hypothetical protein
VTAVISFENLSLNAIELQLLFTGPTSILKDGLKRMANNYEKGIT